MPPGWFSHCVHFIPVDQSRTCRAGVAYSSVVRPGVHLPMFPCFRPCMSNRPKGSEWPTCQSANYKGAAIMDKEDAQADYEAKMDVYRSVI